MIQFSFIVQEKVNILWFKNNILNSTYLYVFIYSVIGPLSVERR